MTETQAGQVTELWRYAGRRAGQGDALFHEWLTTRGPRWWKAKRTRYAVGSAYEVTVTWKDDDHVTMHGEPVFIPDAPVAEQTAAWETADHQAAVGKRLAALERAAKSDTALNRALAPLEDIAGNLISGADLDALVAYVTRRLYQAPLRRERGRGRELRRPAYRSGGGQE